MMMDNFTNFNQSVVVFNFRPNIWLFDTVLNGILVVLSFYLLLALIFHELKIEQPQKTRFLSLSLENKYGIVSKYTCILIAVASLLRHCNAFGRKWLDLYVVNSNLSLSQEALVESACKVLPLLSNFTQTFGSSLVFQFLWFRQRVFYIHPSLKILSHKFVKFFSFVVIIVWLLYYISLYPAFYSLVHYHYVTQFGCLVKEDSFRSYSYIIISWGAMSIFIQLALLFLFIYPILNRTSWRGNPKNEVNIRLMERVKKAIFLTSVCFGTDLLSIIVTQFLFVKNANSITSIFGSNLLINHLITIACFDYWKQLLWPWNSNPKSCFRSRSSRDTTSFTEKNCHSTQTSAV